MVASLGVVGAAVYALRLFIAAMHNRIAGRGHLARDRAARGRGRRARWCSSSWCWPSTRSSACGAPSQSVKAAVIPSELFAEGFNPTILAGGGAAYFTYGTGHRPTDLP